VCELSGYVGVFEAAFIRASTDPRLIDFNPRFFGQMRFDVVRGLPAPWRTYLPRRDRRRHAARSHGRGSTVLAAIRKD
jgi:hypothetical protein